VTRDISLHTRVDVSFHAFQGFNDDLDGFGEDGVSDLKN
jgi:hypothetical protein